MPEPAVWQHDLFYVDGTPYGAAEVQCFKTLHRQARHAAARGV